MLFLYIFILGICIGSFLNVLIYRFPRSISTAGRSFCPNCKKKISWYDNIPLISFILLRGRCRHCHFPISWRYPIVELITGISTVLLFYGLWLPPLPGLEQAGALGIRNFMEIFTLFYLLFSIYALIVIFFTDLETEIIPDKVIYPAILLSFVYAILNYGFPVNEPLLSGLLAGLFFLVLFLITRGRGIGFGDIELALFMGLFLGFPKIIIALYSAFLTGAAAGVILVFRGKKTLKSHLPFGPFLVAGTVFALFFGQLLWEKLIKGFL